MSEFLSKFEKAYEDRLITKDDVKAKLSDLSIDDWKGLSEHYKNGNMAFGPLNHMWVENKEDRFVVHNDMDKVNDSKLLTDVGHFLLGCGATAVGGGVGAFLSHRGILARGGWIGLGVGIGAGILLYKSGTRELTDLQAAKGAIEIPKAKLPGYQPEEKTAFNSSALSKALKLGVA